MPQRHERISEATADARGAFFAQLAQSFPEIRSGDLDPATFDAFDRACEDVTHAWLAANTPRSLSHDQLQGLGRLADDLSKGAHGSPVVGVALYRRPDGLADVVVNGERQTFAMDEYGNPVSADA